ncbi:MAG: TonB-dependent receptor [Thiobacillaceae bacterium]
MRTQYKTLTALLSTTLWLATATASADDELFQLSLEQLLNTEVTGASKFAQKASEAPASVSVITAQEIRAHGWRNITDLLNSVRGVYGSYDRNYSYIGVRGFSRPQDYNTRVLMLVDGHRINDPVYGLVLAGNEFPLDLEMIERVEFVRGSGSALYGSGAFFGVLNIITKTGKDAPGARVGLEVGNDASQRGTVSWGQHRDGHDVLLSASASRSDGQNLYFPEFDTPASNNGLAVNLDGERNHRLFGKIASGDLTLQAFHSSRTKAIPTASYSQVFNQPGSQTMDAYTLLGATYNHDFDHGTQLDAHLAWLRYDYQADFLYDYPPITTNHDKTLSSWWSGELRLLTTPLKNHKLLTGAEFSYSPNNIMQNFDDAVVYLDDRRSKRSWGVYVQDEISLGEQWTINLGVRHDREPDFSLAETHPRIALIYQPGIDTTLKLLHGTAYRAPSPYEAFYINDTTFKANPDLVSESIRSTELVAEHFLRRDWKLTAEAYVYDVTDLINLVTDPSDGKLQFINAGDVYARGLGLEAEHAAEDGSRLRLSYAWQQTRDQQTGQVLSNSPAHLVQLNYQTPLWGERLLAGVEMQYQSQINAVDGLPVASFAIVNLNLAALKLAPGLDVSLGVFNLFDRAYAYSTSEEHSNSLGDTLHSIRQDGRSFRLRLGYQF